MDDVLKMSTRTVGLGYFVPAKYIKGKLQWGCTKGFFFFVFCVISVTTYNISFEEFGIGCVVAALRDVQITFEKLQCIKMCSAVSSLFLQRMHQFGERAILGCQTWHLSPVLRPWCSKVYMKNLHFLGKLVDQRNPTSIDWGREQLEAIKSL